jgi:hypothetical protein
MRIRLGIGVMGLLVVGVLAGCNGPTTTERFRQLDQKVRELTDQVEKLNGDLASKNALITAQQQQIATLQRLGAERLEKLYYVTAIKLERLTGGADYDGKPGDDGITVYLQPVDQNGHVIKAAGDIRIELFDLSNPDGRRLIGEYVWDVDHTRELWHGRLMTHHYTAKCPWRTGPPAHDEVTIRVAFTDYLTGQTFRAQQVAKIRSP